MTATITVTGGTTATQLVRAGDPPTMISNPGPNTIYLGDNDAIRATDSTGVIPLGGAGLVNVDGSKDLFGICATGQTQIVYALSGGINFFSPPSLAGLGGIALFVQSTMPTQPPVIPVNSIWFDTSNNSLQYWNGLAWNAQVFAGNQLIQAGTIVANLIAAGTVVGGIVNGTEIDGATFKVKNAFGAVDLLLDSGTDAIYLYADTGSATQGAVLAALAAAATTDPIDTTSVPQGLFTQQLTLANQSSAPPSFASASVFYSSIAGRPRYKSSAGADNAIERADVNVSQFTIGNTTTPNVISSALSYEANEGNQGSEYELEIDGVVITGTVAGATLTFALAVDGTVLGGAETIGAVFLADSLSYAYTVRARLTILTTGSSGTCLTTTDGAISRQATNAGSATNPLVNTPFGATSGATSKSFDTTSNHSLTIYATWGSTNTGQSLTTYRTRVTRRN